MRASMGSSQELFLMHGDKNGDSRPGFYGGRNGSIISSGFGQDTLGKFKSLDSQFAWFSADSPTTTLSIGSDFPVVGKREPEEQVHETTSRLETWSTASDPAAAAAMQNSSMGQVLDNGGGGGLEEFQSPNSQGLKRKRPGASITAGRGGRAGGRKDGVERDSDEGDSGGDGDDSEGIVLYWGPTGRGDSSGVDALTSNVPAHHFGSSRVMEGGDYGGAVNQQGSREGGRVVVGGGAGRDLTSGSSDDAGFDFEGASLAEDQETLLQLGQTLGVARGGGRSSNISSGEGMLLGLGPADNSNEMPRYETTLDGVPVIDEGSSSARMSKTRGGFMPALLMGSNINGAPSTPPQSSMIQQRQQQKPGVPTPHLISLPELRNYRESVDQHQQQQHVGAVGVGAGMGVAAAEQDLSMSIRNSTSGGTTSTSGASASVSASASASVSGVSDRAGKVCKFRGCSKGARGASGLCIAHGGGQRCEKNGCNKGAEGRTVYCKAHGGGRRCQNLGCTKSAEGKTDYCIGHGGGRRCSHEGCDKAARGRSGLCIRHGGGKRCLTEGCTKSAEGYSGLCISHGGGRRCHFAGCSKGAQGSTMFCKAHGGGKRCMIQGCNKGAEGSTPLCKGHGGGKRCMFDGGGICTKSVHGGTLYCVAHGGGKRCQVEGCSKSARGRTDFCVRHGGGKRCKVEGCGKSAQGSTDFCKAHGGGKRCQWGVEGSGFGEPAKGEVCDKFARGKTGLCAAHSAQVQDRRVHGGTGLGPGLTPGLFRGLVNGSGQGRLSMGASSASGAQEMFGSGGSYDSPGSSGGNNSGKDDGNTIGSGLSGPLFSTSMSGRGGGGGGAGNTSTKTNVGLGADHLSVSPVGGGQRKSPGSVTPSFPANFSIGQPLIPPQVLVPLSMQTKDTSKNGLNNNNHKRPPRPPASTDGGGLSMAARPPGTDAREGGGGSPSEGRVHGGGLMALLSRDKNTFAVGLSSMSLGISSSPPSVKGRWPNVVGGQMESDTPGMKEDGPLRQKQLGSLGADDVGQFLAARS